MFASIERNCAQANSGGRGDGNPEQTCQEFHFKSLLKTAGVTQRKLSAVSIQRSALITMPPLIQKLNANR
jgi:hypothetical protein